MGIVCPHFIGLDELADKSGRRVLEQQDLRADDGQYGAPVSRRLSERDSFIRWLDGSNATSQHAERRQCAYRTVLEMEPQR